MLVPIFKTTSACCEAQNFDGLLASHIMHLICGGILLGGGKGVYDKYNLKVTKSMINSKENIKTFSEK